MEEAGSCENEKSVDYDAAVSSARLDDGALAELDKAGVGFQFDTDLLTATPAKDMRLKMEQTIGLLEAVDHTEFLKKQSWYARFTGADVEARLRFELSSQDVVTKVTELRLAAENGRRIYRLLESAKSELLLEQTRLETVIADAKALLQRDEGADEFVRARYERRLANIVAINVSNVSTIEQIELSKAILKTLIDRFTDVDTTLFPLWQRNVLALAQAAPGERARAGSDVAASKADLIKYLKQG